MFYDDPNLLDDLKAHMGQWDKKLKPRIMTSNDYIFLNSHKKRFSSKGSGLNDAIKEAKKAIGDMLVD